MSRPGLGAAIWRTPGGGRVPLRLTRRRRPAVPRTHRRRRSQLQAAVERVLGSALRAGKGSGRQRDRPVRATRLTSLWRRRAGFALPAGWASASPATAPSRGESGSWLQFPSVALGLVLPRPSVSREPASTECALEWEVCGDTRAEARCTSVARVTRGCGPSHDGPLVPYSYRPVDRERWVARGGRP